jgi:hypothetical protein
MVGCWLFQRPYEFPSLVLRKGDETMQRTDSCLLLIKFLVAAPMADPPRTIGTSDIPADESLH